MNLGSNSAARRFWLPVSVILLIQITLGISTANRFGITYDEYNHLPVGLLNLRTGEFNFDALNPPLCRMIAALPLLGTEARTGPPGLPRATTDWSEVFIAANRDRYEKYFALRPVDDCAALGRRGACDHDLGARALW